MQSIILVVGQNKERRNKMINEESILIAERREYISKLHYWKGQEKKAKKYILKYDDTIKKLDKDIEQRKEKRDE